MQTLILLHGVLVSCTQWKEAILLEGAFIQFTDIVPTCHRKVTLKLAIYDSSLGQCLLYWPKFEL